MPSTLKSEPSPPTSPAMASKSQSPLSDGEIDDDNQDERADSPTLDDLNERKKRLLNALDDSTISITTAMTKSIEDDSLIDDIMALQDDESTLEVTQSTDENCETSIVSDGRSATPATPEVQAVVRKSLLHASKETLSGTPVIQGVSPFNNLPNCEKWREGVSDVMDFENLPESVGKYEKMRTLLEKVRVKVKKIQYEDDDDDVGHR